MVEFFFSKMSSVPTMSQNPPHLEFEINCQLLRPFEKVSANGAHMRPQSSAKKNQEQIRDDDEDHIFLLESLIPVTSPTTLLNRLNH